MSGSTGTVCPTEPFVGNSCKAAATSGPRPKRETVFWASSADMVDWPSKAEVTHTLCRPTALAIASNVRFFCFLAARMRSVASQRFMHGFSWLEGMEMPKRLVPLYKKCPVEGKEDALSNEGPAKLADAHRPDCLFFPSG